MLCFIFTKNGSDRSIKGDGRKRKSSVSIVLASVDLMQMLTCLHNDIKTLVSARALSPRMVVKTGNWLNIFMSPLAH